MTAAFGTTARTPIRWTLSGSTWIRTNLGGVDGMIPIAVSNDGNTIVGVGGTASDAWIWKPHMTAPMDLATYLTMSGVDLAGLGLTFGTQLSRGLAAMSRDAGVLLGSFMLDTPCLPTGGGVMVCLNGTGVACEPPRMVYHPVSQDYSTPPAFGGILNCMVGGSLPLTYQWEKQDPTDPNNWIPLQDDNCTEVYPQYFLVKGSQGPQLRIGWVGGDLSASSGTYRCVVTNSCGNVTSNPATLRFGGACCFSDEACMQVWASNANPLGCAELGGVYWGDFTTCNPNPCQLGACCDPTGGCQDKFELECQAPSIWHAGVECSMIQCLQVKGDMNCDGLVDGLDIQHFVQALLDPVGYMNSHPNCNILLGDINNDTLVDTADIPGFVNLLTGP